ncbi:MAG: hypothetical protein AAFP97_10025, partial [Pseudomonadota bacterium]
MGDGFADQVGESGFVDILSLNRYLNGSNHGKPLMTQTRRVVVTGLGIISCIGNDAATVTESLKNGTCGIKHDPKMAELGFRSQVSGRPEDTSELAKEVIGKRSLRFMGDAAIWS